MRWHQIWRNPWLVAGHSGGAAQSSMPYGTGWDRMNSMWSDNPDYCPADANDQPEDLIFHSSRLAQFSNILSNKTTSEYNCRSSAKTRCGGTHWGVTDWIQNDAPGSMPIWRFNLRIKNTFSQCFHSGSKSGPSCSTRLGGKRPQLAWLPELFMVGYNSVVRFDH